MRRLLDIVALVAVTCLTVTGLARIGADLLGHGDFGSSGVLLMILASAISIGMAAIQATEKRDEPAPPCPPFLSAPSRHPRVAGRHHPRKPS